MKTLHLEAPAKINLGLRVLNRRSDGFHNIRSIFHTISLYDMIQLNTYPGKGLIYMTVSGDNSVPEDSGNLAWKAARAFMDSAKINLNMEIILRKNIPSCAGLGGGSSDAAAILKGLSTLTGKNPGLFRIAEKLGSDVPFFLSGGAALVEGRGEQIKIVSPGKFYIVILHTDLKISTADAYNSLDMYRNSLTVEGVESNYCCPNLEWLEGEPFPADLENDFLQVLLHQYPELEEVIGIFRKSNCSDWALSGKGPSFYGLFSTRAGADRFASEIPGLFSPIVGKSIPWVD